jgi:membrane protein YdbS with pleckstrin-like domain
MPTNLKCALGATTGLVAFAAAILGLVWLVNQLPEAVTTGIGVLWLVVVVVGVWTVFFLLCLEHHKEETQDAE